MVVDLSDGRNPTCIPCDNSTWNHILAPEQACLVSDHEYFPAKCHSLSGVDLLQNCKNESADMHFASFKWFKTRIV